MAMERLTVYARLKLLPTNLAHELAYAGLFVELDRYGVIVIAEETCERRWKRVFLQSIKQRQHLKRHG